MLNRTRVAFVVFGVHKDGLTDPTGQPFVDDTIVEAAKRALRPDLDLDDYPVVIASKREARDCLLRLKCDDSIQAVVLFARLSNWQHDRTELRFVWVADRRCEYCRYY